jgi:hypothetical protein
MIEKIKPLTVGLTTENGINTNEPKGSNANSSTNNSTEDLGFMQHVSRPQTLSHWNGEFLLRFAFQ